jgi:hypothetical protein
MLLVSIPINTVTMLQLKWRFKYQATAMAVGLGFLIQRNSFDLVIETDLF